MHTFSFQNGGSSLCAVDDSNDHVLSVWDWQKEERLADVKVSPSLMLGRLAFPTGSLLRLAPGPSPSFLHSTNAKCPVSLHC